MNEPKEIAQRFLQLVVDGRIDEAYERYVDPKGRHHNVYFAAGFPALKEAMKDNHQQFPHKKLDIRHVLGDGDLVAVHSRLAMQAGDSGMVVVHIVRVEDDKIVELWDMGSLIPADSPNIDGPF